MQSFKVYQIKPTKAEIDDFNKGIASPRVEARRNMGMFFDNNELANETADMLRQGLYDYVADIEAKDLEDAFHLGNNISSFIDHIKVHGHSMMSVSMGDILEDESGELFVVAQWGFFSLTSRMNEAA